MKYVIKVIDRKTEKIVQEELRKTKESADRLWWKAMKNVNHLKYHLKMEELP